jgi:hypothetical protein
VRKSRKQQGGEPNQLTWELDEMDRVFPDREYEGHKIFWTEEPINVPEKKGAATYIGEFWLDYKGHLIMQGRGRLVYEEENPSTGRHTIYDGYWNKNKKHGMIDFEYMNGDHGYAEFRNDKLVGPDDWNFAPTYNYADGRVYEGELVIKDGRAVPLDYNEGKPRTVFNFAPGPKDFLNFKGDYVELDKREAERGFRMSEHPDAKKKAPATPANSPQPVHKVVKSSTSGIRGLKGRVHEARLTSHAPVKMNREEEMKEMRKLASSQSGLSVLRGFERKAALPPIQSARDTGMGHRHSRKKRKNKTKTHRKHKSRRHK